MKRILLVDDDAYFRQFYGDALKHAGFQVDFAENGEVALAEVKKQDYALLIVDLVMPIMSGAEFLKAVKRRKVPRIVLTNLSGETDRSDAKERGAMQFLEKSQTTPADLVRFAQSMAL